MKTIREIYNIMPLDNAVMKDGKALFRVKDVIAAAKKKGIGNPEKLLKKEAKSGKIKVVIEKLVDFEPEARYIVRKLKIKKKRKSGKEAKERYIETLVDSEPEYIED